MAWASSANPIPAFIPKIPTKIGMFFPSIRAN